jgi:DNA-binding MarR family transcriptional regulator
MTVTLAGLTRLGLIDRTPDPTDGRRQLISLTRKGRRRTDTERDVRGEWLARELQRSFSEEERRVINEALQLLQRL